MKMAWFGVEEWLNPMDSLAQVNLGSSCVKAITMDELFSVTGEDQGAFMKDMETMSLHYHHGDATGSPRVKAAVAGIYPKGNVSPDQVMMVHGGTGANDIVLMGLLELDENCVVIKPSYQQHYDIPKSINIETRIYQLEESNNYEIDFQKLRQLCDKKTKCIVLTNPNNPIGKYFGGEVLSSIVELAKEYGAYVLCDEMYRGLAREYMPSILDFNYDKAISVSSLSKMFSMAGTRIGWIVCKDEEMYENFKTRRSYNTICCGIIDEIIASIALENYQAMFERARNILLPNKEIIKEWVSTQPKLTLIDDPMGTTCLIKYDYDVDSETLAIDAMEEDKILFVPGDYFDMPNTIRVGYGAFGDPEALKDGLARFAKYLTKWD
ncbi:MAG: aminotransferase class I/II-fold pyridoxal phosphate-dependent enzyme [Anaerovoracaceae bacterium]